MHLVFGQCTGVEADIIDHPSKGLTGLSAAEANGLGIADRIGEVVLSDCHRLWLPVQVDGHSRCSS